MATTINTPIKKAPALIASILSKKLAFLWDRFAKIGSFESHGNLQTHFAHGFFYV